MRLCTNIRFRRVLIFCVNCKRNCRKVVYIRKICFWRLLISLVQLMTYPIKFCPYTNTITYFGFMEQELIFTSVIASQDFFETGGNFTTRLQSFFGEIQYVFAVTLRALQSHQGKQAFCPWCTPYFCNAYHPGSCQWVWNSKQTNFTKTCSN